MAFLKSNISRRKILRGTLGGVGVTVALPFLDCFLNGNGTALASGQALPVRFGTWFWGLGMDKAVFTPKKVGADYDLPLQIESWKGVSQHINLYSNYNVVTDGRPLLCHYTGWVALRSGVCPTARGDLSDPSIDVLVADVISGANRFRSIDCTATASVDDTYSYRNSNAINPPSVSPEEFYQKMFGPEFQDPNAPEFKPKPEFMARRSVLSAVGEQSSTLKAQLGAADRARLDQYFTSLRELEQRLDLQMQKPPPAPSCKVTETVKGAKIPEGIDTMNVAERHKLMSDLMAMALACNQTRVFNMTYSNSQTGLSKKGLDKSHHAITHEEPFDTVLGYQPTNHYFVIKAMESWAYFVKALASVPEGAGSVLDNSVVYAHSDHEYAKVHSVSGIPMMTAGKAGGRLKTGLHVDGQGGAPTQLGYTLLKTMGSPLGDWGKGSLKTSRLVSEILV
jgi:hypothetical protein